MVRCLCGKGRGGQAKSLVTIGIAMLGAVSFPGSNLPAAFRWASQEKTCSARVSRGPTNTPLSVPPKPVDPEGTKRAFEAGLLNIRGSTTPSVEVRLWFLIGKSGAVEDTRVSNTSGSAELDSLAVSLAREIRFQPATLQGEPTCVWLMLRAPFPRLESPGRQGLFRGVAW